MLLHMYRIFILVIFQKKCLQHTFGHVQLKSSLHQKYIVWILILQTRFIHRTIQVPLEYFHQIKKLSTYKIPYPTLVTRKHRNIQTPERAYQGPVSKLINWSICRKTLQCRIQVQAVQPTKRALLTRAAPILHFGAPQHNITAGKKIIIP